MGSFLSSQSQAPQACSPAATPTATASPQWMLLAPYGGGYGKACNITGDPDTIAAAANSNGHRISVSLRRDPFSALSRICLRFLPGSVLPSASCTVVAAHGGSVLVRITSRERYLAPYAYDYFVYSNVGAARPPSLYLLPLRGLDSSATGLLCRRGEAEFVVAELKVLGPEDDDAWAAAKAAGRIVFRPVGFELRLFRDGKWCVKRPRIIHGGRSVMDGYELWLQALWETTAVVPLGTGMLCWVGLHSGVIFSDVLDDVPNTLRYVPYPEEAVVHRRERFVCTDARGGLKLVSMAPHLCSHCGCCEHATAFDIWTLKDMAWVLETETSMVDSADLWVLPAPYKPPYARTHLVYPVTVSMDGGGHCVVASKNCGSSGDVVSDESAATMEQEDEHTSLSDESAASMEEEDEDMSLSASTDVVSDESTAPMEEDDEHISLSVSTPSATVSLYDDGLQGGKRATSASTSDQQQGDNGAATAGRWPKRRRRPNSMVTGPEWIV